MVDFDSCAICRKKLNSNLSWLLYFTDGKVEVCGKCWKRVLISGAKKETVMAILENDLESVKDILGEGTVCGECAE